MSGLEYINSEGINNLNTLQRLAAATKKFFWETFLKYCEIPIDNKKFEQKT